MKEWEPYFLVFFPGIFKEKFKLSIASVGGMQEYHFQNSDGYIRWCSGKESTCNAGDGGSLPGSGRSGLWNGNPLHYSCLENFIDRGAWWTAVHGAAKSWTGLSTHAHRYICCSYTGERPCSQEIRTVSWWCCIPVLCAVIATFV